MSDTVSDKTVYTKAEAEALCEIAVAAVKKSIADYCRACIVPSYQGGGTAIESANAAYKHIIGVLGER